MNMFISKDGRKFVLVNGNCWKDCFFSRNYKISCSIIKGRMFNRYPNCDDGKVFKEVTRGI